MLLMDSFIQYFYFNTRKLRISLNMQNDLFGTEKLRVSFPNPVHVQSQDRHYCVASSIPDIELESRLYLDKSISEAVQWVAETVLP
jgi:hypothetical protein